ncbi:MAG: hypothetical protein RB296_05080 [Acidobacteriota bacterium]|jgi:hypothetical protein|nr:hypothetical protein [Acidobacteriota bacterium]
MNVKEIAAVLGARVAVGAEYLDRHIDCAGACFLQSVILARGDAGMLLVTGQLTPQTIHACSLSDVTTVVLVRDSELTAEAHRLAINQGMVVLIVPDTLYDTCGKLYSAGLPGLRI